MLRLYILSAEVPSFHIDENWRDKFFEERKGKYFGGVLNDKST